VAQIRWGQSVEKPERGANYGRTATVSVAFLIAVGGALALPPVRNGLVTPVLEMTLSNVVASKGPGLFWEDGEFLEPRQIIAARDLTYLIREYQMGSYGAGGKGHLADAAKMRATVEAMRLARTRWPQASLFKCVAEGGRMVLQPYDWAAVSPTQSRSFDIAIVGGELSSITTAVAAADAGYHVGLIVAGPLGGLSSDSGGNMRYFDYYPPTPRTAAEQKIFKFGLGGGSRVSIPPNTSEKLARYLRDNYAGRIDIVKTRSYDSINVEQTPEEIRGVVLAEGLRIRAKRYLDMDPESRLGEKAGVEIDVDTPTLSYGMVFDLNGLNNRAWANLDDPTRYSPAAIMAHYRVSLQQVEASDEARKVLEVLQRVRSKDRIKVEPDFRYGYSGLSEGFHFAMICRALAGDHSPALKWLNQRRVTSGFNVALNGDQGTFNSVSYLLNRSLLQHSHSLSRDPQFAPIREVEIPALQDYLRWAAGDDSLRVRMPEEFYVRRSTAFFITLEPMRRYEENTKGSGLFTCYSMDLRDLRSRDETGAEVVNSYIDAARHVGYWPNRASMSATQFRNLYLVNKCAATPRYSGGMRIEQNQMNQGVAVIKEIMKEMPSAATK
jgi:hypothetical protein